MNEVMTREQEIREAIAAGKRAYSALTEAERYLDTAKGWGLWDLMGGGFISSMIKHSKMDEAQRCMERAQHELQNFSRELRDVEGTPYMQINCDSLTKFFDVFCDNFLVDLIVQSRIRDAKRSVGEAKESVHRTVLQLEDMLRY